ncbi:unnamed protein product [Phaeothamnion confervicola]
MEEVAAATAEAARQQAAALAGTTNGAAGGAGRQKGRRSGGLGGSIGGSIGDGGPDGGGSGGGGSGGGWSSGAAPLVPRLFGWPQGTPPTGVVPPLIVVDAANVAMRHGLKKRFSVRGIALAVTFFRSGGHRVLGFLPDYLLSEDRQERLRRAKQLGVGEVRPAQLPDDAPLLRELVESGVLIGTPPQDYDDSYCLQYALRAGGYVLSNDLFRDAVKAAAAKDRRQGDAVRRWIKSHVISYTFVGDELLPNPDFAFLDQG